MNKTNYRPGSMGEADSKSNKRALIIFAVVFGVIALLFTLPIPLYPHQWFKAAGRGWQIFGVLGCISFYVFLATEYKDFIEDTISQTKVIVILTAIMVASIGCLAGWNFSL